MDRTPEAAAAAADARLWRGVPRAERVSERRARLLEAGLEVFGTVGHREATVSAVCQSAQLTQRYFYESFVGLDALLAEVFVAVTDAQHARITRAALDVRARGGDLTEAAHASLTAYYGGLQADPRTARVQLFEVLGGDEHTSRCYLAALRRAASLVLVVGEMRVVPPPALPQLLAHGLIGAAVEIATTWVLADFADPLEVVVASAVAVFAAVGAAQPVRAPRPAPADIVLPPPVPLYVTDAPALP